MKRFYLHFNPFALDSYVFVTQSFKHCIVFNCVLTFFQMQEKTSSQTMVQKFFKWGQHFDGCLTLSPPDSIFLISEK